MRRGLKTVMTMALALAIGLVPALLDRCADGCAAHRQSAAVPSCHHAAAATASIGQVPPPCDHGEATASLVAVKGTAPALPAGGPTPAAADASIPPLPAPPLLRLHGQLRQSPPGSSLTLDTHSLPLRT